METTALLEAIAILRKIYPNTYIEINKTVKMHPAGKVEEFIDLWLPNQKVQKFNDVQSLTRYAVFLTQITNQKEEKLFVNDLLGKGGL